MLTLDYIARSLRECSASIGVDYADAQRHVQIAINAFGWDWMRDLSSRYSSRRIPLLLRHPVVKDLMMLESNNLVRLLEISRILVHFCSDPRIDEVLAHMRDPQKFKSFFFALGMAYRFCLAGAEAVLEPDTSRGRGDFLIQYGPFQACCECYRQEKPKHDATLDHLWDRFVHFWPSSAKRPGLVRLVVVAIPKGVWESPLKRLTQTAIEQFDSAGLPVYVANDFCTVSVQPFPEDVPERIGWDYIAKHFPDADAIVFSHHLPRDLVEQHRKGEKLDLKIDDRSHMMVLFLPPESSPKSPSVAKKLSRKLAQAKTAAPGVARLLCVEAWPFGEPPVENPESQVVVRQVDRLCVNRPDVAGVMFAKRKWYPDNTFRYHLYLRVNRMSRPQFPLDMWRKLVQHEKLDRT